PTPADHTLSLHDALPISLPLFQTAEAPAYPLALRTGRTLTHFHAFYDHGRALPTLAAADPEPRLWISPADAARRAIADGDAIRRSEEHTSELQSLRHLVC